MISQLIILIIAIIVIWLCANQVVKKSQELATKLKISTTFLGLTLLSIGTSVPEIGMHVISSIAILKGKDVSGIALGTNIGSNIVQVTAIMGIIALFAVIKSSKEFIKKDYFVMLGTIILTFLLGVDGTYSRFDGLILMGVYIYYIYRLAKTEHFIGKMSNHDGESLWVTSLLLILFLGILLVAAHFALGSAEFIATYLGISDSLIGVALIGVSTALPELSTALSGLRRKDKGLSIGVLIGSNITNPLVGIGLGSLISTYIAIPRVVFYDLPMWFLIASLTLIPFWRKGYISKKEGIFLIGFYILYIAVRIYLR